MANNVLGLILEIDADPAKAAAGFERLRASAATTFDVITKAGQRTSSLFQNSITDLANLAHASQSAFDQMTRRVQGWGNTALNSFALVAKQILSHIAIEQLAATETGRAEAEKTLIRKTAVREQAAVEAVAEAAAGFGALGDFDFWAAAQHFASAALWGSLAALEIAGAVGAFGAGSEGGRSRARSGKAVSGPAPSGPPVMASGYPTGAVSGQVTVLVVGTAEAGQWIASVINTHVERNGGRLVSSHTRRPAPAGA